MTWFITVACSGEDRQESLAGPWGAQGTKTPFLCIRDQPVILRGPTGRCRVSGPIYLCQMVLKCKSGAHVASIQQNARAMLWPFCLQTNEPLPGKSQWQSPRQPSAKPLCVPCGARRNPARKARSPVEMDNSMQEVKEGVKESLFQTRKVNI